ncbi:carboxymuconolactone decarboxylase family protein [Mycolicibacter senuensis]|uniref:carboxymuconolactone decarboxylase family protein n=1 Tax=Mycolicibacter senuensis TaxID=386913 RepID=UPI000DCF07F9|nr:carboxymuconolactone decarboxylase family protein [Mycolicibacter senuensis]RAV03869.1 carboxymuconolactone decarboxylase family protein [Mycolicibacter senuensis]
MSDPLIAPVPDAELSPDLAAAITGAVRDGALSSTVLPRIWARRPELAQAQIALHRRFYDSSVLPGRLLELVRLRIAAINQCEVCQTSRKSADVSEEDIACLAGDDPRFSPAERAALAFAEAFATDHLSLGPADFDRLGDHFNTDEIVEIAMFAAQMVGSGRLAYALRAFESRP